MQFLAGRLHTLGEAYLQLISVLGIEPTNSLAKQAIQLAVIDWNGIQATPSAAGQREKAKLRPLATTEHWIRL